MASARPAAHGCRFISCKVIFRTIEYHEVEVKGSGVHAEPAQTVSINILFNCDFSHHACVQLVG